MVFTLQTVAEGKIRSISAACTRKSAYGNAAEPFPHFARKPWKTLPQIRFSLPISRCFRLVFQDLALGIIKKARCTIAFCSAPVFVHFRQVPIIKQRFAVWIPFINAFASFPALSKGFCCAHKRALQQHIGKLWKGCRQCLCMFGWFIFHRIGSRLNACGFSRRFHLKLLFAFRGSHFAQAFL